jgi:hypothetical protein
MPVPVVVHALPLHARACVLPYRRTPRSCLEAACNNLTRANVARDEAPRHSLCVEERAQLGAAWHDTHVGKGLEEDLVGEESRRGGGRAAAPPPPPPRARSTGKHFFIQWERRTVGWLVGWLGGLGTHTALCSLA